MIFLKDIVKILSIRNALCEYAYNKCGIRLKSVKYNGKRLVVITKDQAFKIYNHYYNESNDYVKIKSLIIPIKDIYLFFKKQEAFIKS